MLNELAAAVDTVEIPPDGDAVIAAIGVLDRFVARLALGVAGCEAAGVHEADGATSMVAWLVERAGMGRGPAQALARRARLAVRLPVTSQGWVDGRLSGGQVEAILDNVDADTVELFAEHEAEVVPKLVDLSAKDAATVMRTWRDLATADREPRPERPQRLHLSRGMQNRWMLDGDLDAETGELLATALRMAQTGDVEGEPARAVATRRADALGDICRRYLDSRGPRPGGRERPHLNLIVDGDRMAEHGRATGESPDGTLFDHPRVERLLCDCTIHRVVMKGGSAIIDYGYGTRTVSASLWNALVVRDRHCRFPGCDRPPEWSEGHHVRPWPQGPTNPENLVVLCVRHHHLVHQSGWTAKLLPDGTLEVTDPKGRVRTTRPPGGT